jgi:hypothetical protein
VTVSSVTVPAHSAIYELFNITNIYNGYWFELMSDPDFAYTGVCLTLRVRELSCDSNAKPSEEVLTALAVALSRIRKRLAKYDSAGDDISVTAVSFMAAIAVRHSFIPKACLATKLTRLVESNWGWAVSSKAQAGAQVHGQSTRWTRQARSWGHGQMPSTAVRHPSNALDDNDQRN